MGAGGRPPEGSCGGGSRTAGERGEVPDTRGDRLRLGLGGGRERRLHVRQPEDPGSPRIRARGNPREDPLRPDASRRGPPRERDLRPVRRQARALPGDRERQPAQGRPPGRARDERRPVLRRERDVPGVPGGRPGDRGAKAGGGSESGGARNISNRSGSSRDRPAGRRDGAPPEQPDDRGDRVLRTAPLPDTRGGFAASGHRKSAPGGGTRGGSDPGIARFQPAPGPPAPDRGDQPVSFRPFDGTSGPVGSLRAGSLPAGE